MLGKFGWILLLVLTTAMSAGTPQNGRVLRVVGGAVIGTAAAVGVTVGIVVVRARVQNHYIESTRDLRDPRLLVIPALAVVGGFAGAAGSATLAAMTIGIFGGGLVGVLAGAVAGSLYSSEPMDVWAGGAMAGSLGILIGLGGGLLEGRRRLRRNRRSKATTGAHGLILAIAGSLAGCAEEIPELPDVPPPPAEAESAESVVYFLGDPGKARYRRYPVLPAITADVERWAERVQADSAVIVVTLGDVIYPDGMHPPGSEGFLQDSAYVADQIDIIRGPAAQRRNAMMLITAGNHDWGMMEDRPGARRLRNLGAFLERVHARGPIVDLVPEAGTGIPHVRDVGEHLRLVLLDTAWWLFDADPQSKPRMLAGIENAITTAGDRAVVVAAHHPYATAGPHGGLRPVWQTLGIRYVLAKSGAVLQDLDSRPYRDLILAVEEIFQRRGRPLLFAGGHEHSLQVIQHDSAAAPMFSLVSGSASKLTDVGYMEGMLFRRSAPGYMRLVTRENGAVDLYVEAAPERYLACPEGELSGDERERCMEEGVQAYETVFAMRLREAGVDSGDR